MSDWLFGVLIYKAAEVERQGGLFLGFCFAEIGREVTPFWAVDVGRSKTSKMGRKETRPVAADLVLLFGVVPTI